MNMMSAGPRGELQRQSRRARLLGSPFVAEVLAAGDRQLDHGPRTAALIAAWPDDPAQAAIGLRFCSAIHALARRGAPDLLASLFGGRHDRFDAAIAAALDAEDAFIAEWMRTPTQTNEVARAGAITAALMELRAETGLPAELLELGASSGLNLNLAHYAYDLGGTLAGDAQSLVRIAPVWYGCAPIAAPLEILSARGVDLKPLDPRDAATRERLLAYVWSDQPARVNRLESALTLAQRIPPRVDRADALDWLAARLAEPQAEGCCRVVFHSMVIQYLSAAARERLGDLLERAGSAATASRPLAAIGFEWSAARTEVRLTLTTWPAGSTRLLAIAHPYGDWIEWRGEAGDARRARLS